MDDLIYRHCAELNRCNQRGGRMLSVFDLLRAGTLDLDLAAYLMARISRGTSFMVGALPGGAGKTTVMCALLNLGPASVSLAAATPAAVTRAAQAASGKRCFICHEISPGDYFAYLWDEDLREYCRLFDTGHILATNLHADDLAEAWDQVCRDNGVPAAYFLRFELLIFLRVTGGYVDARRRVAKVYAGDGTTAQRLIFDSETNVGCDQEWLADPEYLRACRAFLEEGLKRNLRTIEDTRSAVVEFLSQHPPAVSNSPQK